MSHKFNGGRGARICDSCGAILTEGKRQIIPFVTVQLSEDQEANGGYQEAHFCRSACLGSEIARIVAVIDSGKAVDETAADLRHLILSFARWQTAESKVLLPYDHDHTKDGGRMMRVEMVGPVNK